MEFGARPTMELGLRPIALPGNDGVAMFGPRRADPTSRLGGENVGGRTLVIGGRMDGEEPPNDGRANDALGPAPPRNAGGPPPPPRKAGAPPPPRLPPPLPPPPPPLPRPWPQA